MILVPLLKKPSSYNMDILWETTYMIVNPVFNDNVVFFFICTVVSRLRLNDSSLLSLFEKVGG